MQYLVTIALTFFSLIATANNGVTLVIIDGYTNLPMENCSVTITKKQHPIYDLTTTDEGTISLSERKLDHFCIKINDDNGMFIQHYIRHYKKLPDTILVHMIPTREYEEKMFALEDEKYGPPCSKANIHKTDTLTSDNDSLFVDAIFGSGPAELQGYIGMNTEYPEVSRSLGDQGIVYSEFIVEKDGAITHVKTLQSVSEELDNEAKRVIRSMRYWTPAEYDGQKVRVCCTLPIRFVLD